MTEKQERIRRAARELREALNDDVETKYEIGHRVIDRQLISDARTNYYNMISVVATHEVKVFP